MGLFDFFKRKAPPSPAAAAPAAAEEGPRPHYVLAHYALRYIALSDPLRFLGILVSEDAHPFLDDVLSDVAEQLKRPAGFRASDLAIHPAKASAFPCVILELPPPQETTEAFMVALVALVDLSQEKPPTASQITGRYFTLEKGYSFDTQTPRTVLAEWDHDRHTNYGDGPPPDVGAFLAAISQQLGA